MKIYKFVSVNILAMLIMFMFTIPTFAAEATAVVDGVTATGSAYNGDQMQGQFIDSHDTITNERAFAIQGNVQYGTLPGYFGDNSKPGHQFISLTKLLMYNTAWNIKAAYPATYAKMHMNVTPHAEMVKKDERSKVIICTKDMFDKTKFDVKLLAVGACNSANKDIISSDVLDKVLAEAAKYGTTHVQFLAEGTNTELQSSGWGIGVNYTKATESSVATGGTGFSTGWSGYQNLPWQQFFFLKVTNPNAVADITPAIEKADVVVSDVIVDENVDNAVKDATVTQ